MDSAPLPLCPGVVLNSSSSTTDNLVPAADDLPSVITIPPVPITPDVPTDPAHRQSTRLASAAVANLSEESGKPSCHSEKRHCCELRLAIQKATEEDQSLGDDLCDTTIACAATEECSINVTSPDDPKFLHEALGGPDAHLWHPAIEDELQSLYNCEVYELIPCESVPLDRKIMTGEWVLIMKHDGCQKAHLTAWDFQQVYGLNYMDTTSPTTCFESLRVLLHLAASKDLEI